VFCVYPCRSQQIPEAEPVKEHRLRNQHGVRRFQKEQDKCRSRYDFDHEIAAGIRSFTHPASAAQDEVTYDGDIIIPSDITSANRTMARSGYDRLSSGHSPDADIEKASPARTEGKYGEKNRDQDDGVLQTCPEKPVETVVIQTVDI
jgi:hypothetical protein